MEKRVQREAGENAGGWKHCNPYDEADELEAEAGEGVRGRGQRDPEPKLLQPGLEGIRKAGSRHPEDATLRRRECGVHVVTRTSEHCTRDTGL